MGVAVVLSACTPAVAPSTVAPYISRTALHYLSFVTSKYRTAASLINIHGGC